MPLAPRNGVTLHLQELGPGGGTDPGLAAKSSEPVVMLHGLILGSLATWYFTAAPAIALRHRVLMYDLRGHGRSERVSSGYDLGTLARDLSAVVAEGLGDGRISLVGHSYGALIALEWALQYPERVSKLALVEAPLPPSRLPELEEFLNRKPSEMANALPEILKATMVRGERRTAKLIESVGFLVRESSLLADLKATRDFEDARLRQLQVPVQLIYGESSSCRPAGERLATLLSGAQLRVLPGGHFLPIDSPGLLTGALLEFLDPGLPHG